MVENINKCHKNAQIQPSWPKSSVNFFSFTRSSSFTVGLAFSSDLSMSSWNRAQAQNKLRFLLIFFLLNLSLPS